MIRYHLPLALALALAPACVIRPGTTSLPGDTAAAPTWSSTTEALDSVTRSGLATLTQVQERQRQYQRMLADLTARTEKVGDPYHDHLVAYLTRTVAYYDQLVPLYEALDKAPADQKPALAARVYDLGRRYTADLADLDADFALPDAAPTLAARPQEGPVELAGTQPVPTDAEISALYAAGKYAEITTRLSDFASPGSVLSPHTRALYALALGHEGLITEAAAQAGLLASQPLADPVVSEARVQQVLWLLQGMDRNAATEALGRLDGDANLAMDQLERTQAVVVGISEEMGEVGSAQAVVQARAALEEGSLSEARRLIDSVLKGNPTPEQRARAEALDQRLTSEQEKIFDERLAQVRTLSDIPGREEQALTALAEVEKDFPEARYAGRIQSLRSEIKGRAATVPAGTEGQRLTDAQSLLAAGRFEEAAAAFATLESTSVAEQARLGRERAVELYVQQVREESARAYLNAKKITDPQQKLGALAAIYTQMEAVLEKYPDSRMAPKIAQNLNVVRGDILAIDPTFFDAK